MPRPLLAKAFPLEDEYKKDHGITAEDIKRLRQWLDTQPHLPRDFITEMDLILTYHSCDMSMEVSKQVLDLHYTLKTLFNNFFKNRFVDEEMLKIFDVCLVLGLETRSHKGYGVVYARLLDYEPKHFVFMEAVRAVLLMVDMWQYEEGTWPGSVLIIDLENVVMGHLARVDFQTLQQLLYFIQEALLVRLKEIHFMNAPSFMDKLMMLLKPFLNKRFMDMINIHQVGSTTITEYVPLEALPIDVGGKNMTFEEIKEDTKARLRTNAEFFAAENKKRVVEALRPGKAKTITDIFGGVEGSFKKLDID